MNNTPILRAQTGFTRLTDLQLIDRGTIVSSSLFTLPVFADPPVTQLIFDAQLEDLRLKVAARPSGGPAATAAKNESRDTFIATLRELAMWVQVKSGNVLSVLLSSGFEAVPTSRTSEPLTAPVIERLVHGQSGELLLSCSTPRNARGFERQLALVAADGTLGIWSDLGFSKGSRRLSSTGLIPGQRYALRIRAMGGSTNQSDWSGIATIICL